MNPGNNFCVKSIKKVTKNHRIEKEKESMRRKKINFKNVKSAVEKNLIPNLNRQTIFKDKKGENLSLLYAAKDNRDLYLLKFLLKQGIDPNIIPPNRNTFLLEILSDDHFSKNLKLIKMLIHAGADVNKRGTDDFYLRDFPLVAAIRNGDSEVVKLLIKSGADLQPTCFDPAECEGCNPLQAACENEKMIGLADFFLDMQVDADKFCKSGCSPLQSAAIHNNSKLIERLLDQGVDINAAFQDRIPLTALHFAVEEKRVEATQKLLDHELADVNFVDPSDVYSALHLAISVNFFEGLDLLLDANPDVNLLSAEENGAKLPVEEISFDGSNLKAKEMLEIHIVKLRAAGFCLHDRNLAAVSGEKYGSFYAKCSREIDFMKKNTIASESHVTFWDLLFISNQKLALCLESLDFGSFVGDFTNMFPSYAGLIRYKLKKGFQLVKLREELHAAIFSLFQNHLPYLIEEQIFSYFSIRELIKLRYRQRRTEENLVPNF